MTTTKTPEFNLFRNEEKFDTLDPGSTVFAVGDAGDHMFAVRDGEVDLLVDGKVVETVRAGGIFGEMALIEHEARSATAVVKIRCELVSIDERRFEFLVRQHPFFATHMLRLLASRLRRMNEEI